MRINSGENFHFGIKIGLKGISRFGLRIIAG
jgi:hypothetical protein